MNYPDNLGIAVIGDEDLVNGMRLAGNSRYHLIDASRDSNADVRESLHELASDPGVGIIVIQEEYAEHAKDIIDSIRNGKRMTPVIIDVPSKYGTKLGDIGAFYKAYVKRFIGFDVEI